jgi:Ca2+-binding RTX toxin-like protein
LWASGVEIDFSIIALYNLSQAWTESAKSVYRNALQQWANVANITFTEVFAPETADLVEFLYGYPNSSLYGSHQTPEDAANIDGTAWGAYNLSKLTSENVQLGGAGFAAVVHEIGHALGLSHPHDGTVFPGVDAPFDDYGDSDLNQGIYTTMSYNAGWPSQYGIPPSDDWGYQAGPMAFDIAAIQDLYGPNMSFHTGNDTYVLPDVNAPGTYWSCIWDAGGTDCITYGGSGDTEIYLVAATLDNSLTGGGLPSNVLGVLGGYTIASGVVIENAFGGSGNDVIAGNQVANMLAGNAGDDVLVGLGGDDELNGGIGTDTATFYGARNAYLVERIDNVGTWWRVSDSDPVANGNEGSDTLVDFEMLSFLGGIPATITVAQLIGALSDADGAANTVAESATAGTLVGVTAVALDGNSEAVTYSLTEDAGGRFAIGSSSGVVTTLAALDFETASIHEIMVRATSSDGSFTEELFTIGVTDSNDAPTDVIVSEALPSLAEGTSTATRIKVADIDVVDDALGSNLLNLVGADVAFFEIDGSELFLKAGVLLDFESKSSFAVAVQADDVSVGATPDAISAPFIVNVVDVNEAPTAVLLTQTVVELNESASTTARIQVANISVTDDALGSNSLSVTGVDASLFEIVGAALYVKAGVVLDFEAKPSLSVAVSVNDPTVGADPDAVGATLGILVNNVSPEVVLGTNFADLLVGGEDDDDIWGFAGSDQLYGGGGVDFLIGGFGRDYMTGGGGLDGFYFLAKGETGKKSSSRDVILDFERALDWIDLSAIDAKQGSGNQAFKWIGKQGFHGVKGELHFVKKAGYVLVEGDINGDGGADFQIQVDGVGALGRGDFIL